MVTIYDNLLLITTGIVMPFDDVSVIVTWELVKHYIA